MSIRLMTSNIWGDYFGNEVEGRDKKLENIYRKYLPDVLGLQEMTENWWKSPIWKSLEDEYAFVPAATKGKLNYTPLLYRHKTLELLDTGFKLYHEELDLSKGYTWAFFRAKSNNAYFIVFNTHFMWREGVEFDIIRRYNALELNNAMTEAWKVYNNAVFFMGDLNCVHDSPAWKYLEDANWRSSYLIADESSKLASWRCDPERGDDNCFHGKLTDKTCEDSIDHIGASKFCHILRQETVTDSDALDASDHCPVFADIDM